MAHMLPTEDELRKLYKPALLAAALRLLDYYQQLQAQGDGTGCDVMYTETGMVQGGIVSHGFVQRNPPVENLHRIAHRRIDGAVYEDTHESQRVSW